MVNVAEALFVHHLCVTVNRLWYTDVHRQIVVRARCAETQLTNRTPSPLGLFIHMQNFSPTVLPVGPVGVDHKCAVGSPVGFSGVLHLAVFCGGVPLGCV